MSVSKVAGRVLLRLPCPHTAWQGEKDVHRAERRGERRSGGDISLGIAASGPVLDMRTPFGPQDAQTRSAASIITEPVGGETRGQAVHRVSSESLLSSLLCYSVNQVGLVLQKSREASRGSVADLAEGRGSLSVGSGSSLTGATTRSQWVLCN